MDLHDLESIRHIDREIRDYRDKIRELEAIATSTSPLLTGMPRGNGVADKVGKCAAAIADYTELLQEAITEKTEQSRAIHMYILNVDDAVTRVCMYNRYVQGLTWRDVAAKVGGGNTEDGVRKRVTRYICKK